MEINGQCLVYNAESLGQAVKHFREEAGLTQVELADLAGIRQAYISDVESGKMTEQTQHLITLFKVLGARIVVGKADW